MKKFFLWPIIIFFLSNPTYSQDCLRSITLVEPNDQPPYFRFINQIRLEDEKRQLTMVTDAVTRDKSISISFVPNVGELCPDKGDSVAVQFSSGRVVYLQNVLEVNCSKKFAVMLGGEYGNDTVLDSMMIRDLASVTVHHKGSKFRGDFSYGRHLFFKTSLRCLREAITSDTLANALKKVNDSKVFLVVEKQPEYEGGYEIMMDFIRNNMKPQKVIGTVYVGFIIEKDGSLSEVQVVRGLTPEADSEAVRIIASMPKWKPGVQGNKIVRVRFNLPVRFK